MKWRPLEADGGRIENVIYIVIAARWRPVEADGGRTENGICNVIAATWRPVEAKWRRLKTTIIRTRMEASVIGVTSLRSHQHHQSTFHS